MKSTASEPGLRVQPLLFFSPPFLLLTLSFSFVTMILELLGFKKRAFWRFFTRMTANFVRLVLKKSARYTLWRLFEEILKKFVRVVSEIYKKALKVQILNEIALRQVVRKQVLVFKLARTKIHQDFLASKYDIKQHSDAT